MRQTGAGKCRVVAVDRTRGARHQVQRNVEINLDLLGRLQAPGDGGQGLQEGRDRRAVGRLLHGADDTHHLRQQGLLIAAGGSDHGRPFLEECQQRLRPAAKLADDARSFEIGLELRLAEAGERGIDAFFEDVGDGGKAAVQRLPGGLHLRVRVAATARIRDLSYARDHVVSPLEAS
jgi:hypothetical protein